MATSSSHVNQQYQGEVQVPHRISSSALNEFSFYVHVVSVWRDLGRGGEDTAMVEASIGSSTSGGRTLQLNVHPEERLSPSLGRRMGGWDTPESLVPPKVSSSQRRFSLPQSPWLCP
ncbi:hypothetical protein NHX12_011502 [Muraenolepis orangiensis]|uniref:Uncharacterized protein n=1 Tax=Muraenolepis orangiensis TaxID=630683 RepID=A0A9Q0I5S2_9TELE|nr:hypothetical protein NHX12_011502 [Muraenolepis orangiensis]